MIAADITHAWMTNGMERGTVPGVAPQRGLGRLLCYATGGIMPPGKTKDP